jgi:5-methylcytosine-specific restriction endonuclease McrA
MKRCTGCGCELPLTAEFFKPRKDRPGKYTSWCRDCLNERSRAWHRENRGVRLPKLRAYYAAHRDEAAAYYQENAGRIRAYRAAYRARLLDAAGSHTADDVEDQYRRQRGRCYYCGAALHGYHVDHVQPLARGGSNGPENIVVCCPSCNHHKSVRMPHECSGRLC